MKVDIDKIKNMDNIFMIAPAGCGKTETIVDIIKEQNQNKKYLILTHTNAGVECISKRLKNKNVSNSQFKVYTIASFCYKYVNAYPKLSNVETCKRDDYNAIYKGMVNLLINGNIQKVIKSTYSEVLIDEYQDCIEIQHEIIVSLSKIIPCKLFGDPLQGIFGFKDKLVDWKEVANDFSFARTFSYPWRWEKHNKQLGNWIMQTRQKLLNNENIELKNLPLGVQYIYNDDKGINLRNIAYSLLNNKADNLFLFQYEQEAHSFAQKMGGKYYSQEEIECKTLRDITKDIQDNSYNTVIAIYKLAEKCFTQFNAQLGNIYRKIQKRDYNFKRISKNKEIAIESIKAIQTNNYTGLLQEFENNKEMKIYRKELWCELKRVLNEVRLNTSKDISEIIEDIRNTSSTTRKYKYKNLVSRILLVKGLEFNTVVLVNPEKLTKELFYVGISRPTERLIIVSKKNILNFKKKG